jgi:hypothetical protein
MTQSLYLPLCLIFSIIILVILFYYMNNNIKQIYNGINKNLDNYIENFIN